MGAFMCGAMSASCPNETAPVYYYLTDPDTGERIAEGDYCDGPDSLNQLFEPQLQPLISRAFRRLPMPAPDLQVQPPDGKTLVNFATNFYTEERTFNRTVRLLGNRVELRIWVDTYRWDFGDGTTRETAGPGAAYPALTITHNYTRKGTYRPSLEVVYAADYRVDGGAWERVSGTVTRADSPTSLRAVEATPTLVGYDG